MEAANSSEISMNIYQYKWRTSIKYFLYVRQKEKGNGAKSQVPASAARVARNTLEINMWENPFLYVIEMKSLKFQRQILVISLETEVISLRRPKQTIRTISQLRCVTLYTKTL
jgi:hypothetical protein